MKRFLISIIRHSGHALMFPAEYIFSNVYKRPKTARQTPPPIFIIGAPRSGTSLLYELMITGFQLSYLSNAAHRFYLAPLTVTWLLRSTIGRWQGNFTSRYGHINGWGAPNEGGWIWRRWLEDADWRAADDFSEKQAGQLRTLTRGISAILRAPFVNKNVMHSNRLQLMNYIWPDALYIEVQRDIMDNARSIVRAERAEGGPEKHGDIWWSVRPKLAPDYAGKADTERAIAQVVGIENDISADINKIGLHKLLRINYNDLCAAPHLVMDQIETFAKNHNIELAKQTDYPAKFANTSAKLLEPEDEKTMAATLELLTSSLPANRIETE